MAPRAWLAAVAGALALALPGAAAAVPSGSTALVDRPSGFGALPFDGAGNSSINEHALSGNGCFVAFESTGDSLVPSDEDAVNRSVYRVDRCTAGNPIVQANTTSSGAPAEAGSSSFIPSISDDGRYVAFVSDSRVLGGGATSGNRGQVFVKDLQTGALELASRGNGANGDPIASDTILRAVISGSGRQVVFDVDGVFDADNVDGVANERDLYVRELDGHATHMVSVTTTGAAGHKVNAESFDVDDTASRVVFTTSAKLDATNDTDTGFDAYVRLSIGGSGESTQLISRAPGSTSGFAVALSPESTSAAYTDFSHVYVEQCIFSCGTPSQADVPRSGGSSAGSVNSLFFAPDGGAAATRLYWLTTSQLDPSDTDSLRDLYARDLADTNANTAVHLLSGGLAGEVGEADSTDNGGVIVLTATAAGRQFLARVGGQDSVLTHPPGEPFRPDEAGGGFTRGARFVSDDGRVVAFESAAPVFGGSFSQEQIVVRDVASGATTVASVGSDGSSPANRGAFLGGIDAAGNRVVFSSSAGNLVPGVDDGKGHVYVRDLSAGTTRLVDRTGAGNPSADGAFAPRISGDGRRVAFGSSSTDLPAAPFDANSHVYMLDLEAGTSVLVDQTNNGIPGNGSGQNPDIDGSGRHVSFYSSAANLPGGTTGAIYVRNVEATTTTWASIPEDGNPAHQFVFQDTSLSRDGRRIAFGNASPDFGYGAVADLEAFVRDLDAGTTVLASRGPLGAANEGVRTMSLSGDGTKLAFDSRSSNFEGANGALQVYLRDLTAGTIKLVSERDDGGAPRLGASTPGLNGDGSCLAFASRSDDLTSPSYGPDFSHVFLRALSADCPPGSGGGGDGGGGGGGAGQTGPPPPLADARDTPPVVSGFRATNTRFAVAPQATLVSAKAKRGTTFVFSLSEDARTTITMSRAVAGRRKGKRCVKPRKSLKKRCTRLVKVGTLTRSKTKAGNNKLGFTGRIGKKALRRGKYQASLVATDSGAQKSKARVVKFSVVR